MAPTLRSAAGSDIGRRRSMNQDSAAAGPRLLVVADGMGGHAHGEVASTVAVTALLDAEAALGEQEPDDPLAVLAAALDDAAARLTTLATANPELSGTGTTVVAFLVDGTRIAIAHIGDSRAYLLRGGELLRLTRDHTLVQALVDDGRISLEEAASHPRRSWLMRTLQDGTPAEPDLFFHMGEIGDRYLICSDGLTAVLDDASIGEVLAGEPDRAAVVARLIAVANEGGGPDNITCVVSDLADESAAPDGTPVDLAPVLVGAVAEVSPPEQ